jgi:hypothetical protein
VIASEAPPSTFVPADDNIFGPSSYGVSWTVLGIVAVVLGLALLVWCLRRLPAERRIRIRPADVPALKAKYLSTIDVLEHEFVAHHLDERELHHRLSRTVREFAADVGEPGAVAMTASLLEEAGLASAAAVIAGNERPQFKERHRSDPASSCHRAKAVIESW